MKGLTEECQDISRIFVPPITVATGLCRIPDNFEAITPRVAVYPRGLGLGYVKGLGLVLE